ncbi:hypothetical protein MPSI1_000129 [Malassezia psittaci]|uniref:Major facilitator superfamily (MFS) profile domain-containing protein n=1 Tax=Malassezia psittaci TaxID=1821823 RepID=A0AAF0F6X7_9BASI|nr:hypothetical protein MPSI1_000129 [Malassezia psittaci]
MSASRSETPSSMSTLGEAQPFYEAPQAPIESYTPHSTSSQTITSTHAGAAPPIDGAYTGSSEMQTAPNAYVTTDFTNPKESLYSANAGKDNFSTSQYNPSNNNNVFRPSAPVSHAPVSNDQPNSSVISPFPKNGPDPPKGMEGNVDVSKQDLEKGAFSHDAVRGGMSDPTAHGLNVVDDSSDETANHTPENQSYTVPRDDEKQLAQAEAVPKPAEPQIDEKGRIIVKWDGKNDPEHVTNLPFAYRIYLTMLGSSMTLSTAFASSAPSFLLPQIVREFHSTEEVIKASVFLFVGGFCFAPLFWAPISERYGHKWCFTASMLGATAFHLGCAFSHNTATMLVCRIFAGAFASCPMSNVAPMVASFYSLRYLIVSIAMFAMAPMAGPCIGPIVGGFISQSGANWRWVFRVMAIMTFCFAILCIFTMTETLDAVRLKYKAQRVRRETGDNRYVAPIEVREPEKPLQLISKVLGKPVRLFFQEPMLIAVTVYISFVYGTLYLLFDAYPIVFGELHGMRPGAIGLTFLGYLVGTQAGVAWAVFFDNKRYIKLMDKNNGLPPSPEERLHMATVGAPLLVISLFWFAWTSFRSVSYWAPLVAGGVFGASQLLIFLGLMVYMTEVYLFSAASAIAANTVVRSAFGVGFPMFGSQMYHKLNPRWASTVLGFIALVLLPIPFILMRYGKKLRGLSKHAHTMDA